MPRLAVPGTVITLLTETCKMPSRSWSLPAVRSCPSAFFGKDAICGESKQHTTCYATRGAYDWRPVRAAQDARFKWAMRASMDAATGDEFVALLTLAVQQEALRQQRRYYREVSRGDRELGTFEAVYRVHDSGDLFSPSYARLWTRIAQNCPDVRFWIPTRQWRSRNEHMQAALRELAALPNMALRPSALRFNDPAPVIDGLSAGTTASSEGFTCPASTQKNECRDCRACWSKDVVVSYRKH
jgi:hypothetical protein